MKLRLTGRPAGRCAAAVALVACVHLRVAAAPDASPPLPPAETGNLYVSSFLTGEVFVYGPDGAFLDRFSHADLGGTRGLAFRSADELYVGSQFTNRILVFRPDGTYVRQFSGGGLAAPTSLAFRGDELYASSSRTNEIIVFVDDAFTRSFTAPGLFEPNCIAVDADGNLYVASGGSNEVLHFKSDGELLNRFRGGGLTSPMGIALHGDRVYVTGGGSSTVALFSLDGTFLRNIDTRETIPSPQGIAFNRRDQFVISSFSNHRVALFSDEGDMLGVRFEERGVDVARSIAYHPVAVEVIDFWRGDFNFDGGRDISDAIAILNYLFVGNFASRCPDAGDTNDDGAVDISDASYLLLFLFIDGAAPPSPAADPGPDPTADELSCFAAP